jgi:hypothetical protein
MYAFLVLQRAERAELDLQQGNGTLFGESGYEPSQLRYLIGSVRVSLWRSGGARRLIDNDEQVH